MAIAVLYLHGFASSPKGTKVQALQGLLEPEGFTFHVPDLNVPSFEKLDYDAIVRRAAKEARTAQPRVIVGSSLGALIALEVVRAGPLAPLVLIAPAMGVSDRWKKMIPVGDPVPVYNYATERETFIHRTFFDQVEGRQPEREPPPAAVTVIMGRLDESIPFDRVLGVWRKWEQSGRLAAGSRFIEIRNGDHSLTNYVDVIAKAIRSAVAVPS